MKKFVSVLLAVFFTVNTALAAGGDSAGNEIGGLKFSPIVAGDVTDKITAVGALRTTRIPTVVPVSGQSFKRAAVIKNGSMELWLKIPLQCALSRHLQTEQFQQETLLS